MDEMTLQLSSPITDEQMDAIMDYEFDATHRIWFHTKHGKDVEFWKAERVLKILEDVREYHDRKAVEEATEGTGLPIVHIYTAHVLDQLIKSLQEESDAHV